MKAITVFLVLLTLAIGTYLNNLDANKTPNQTLIQDEVESSMAAPVKADIPL
jgi:hypothetical protein